MDHYARLGIRRDASLEEIKKAFRRLARELHPDVNPDPEVIERFKEVNLAYEVLSDPAKKQAYDQGYGRQAAGYRPPQPPPAWPTAPNPGFNFDDLSWDEIVDVFGPENADLLAQMFRPLTPEEQAAATRRRAAATAAAEQRRQEAAARQEEARQRLAAYRAEQARRTAEYRAEQTRRTAAYRAEQEASRRRREAARKQREEERRQREAARRQRQATFRARYPH
jgi:DnaJ-class molecular chaperone